MNILKRICVAFLIVALLCIGGCSNNKNINGYDKSNIIKSIKNDGYYADCCDYRFTNYIKSEHFEIYYNDEVGNDLEYAQKSIDMLEEKYFDIIGFFGIAEKDMPIIKISMYRDNESLSRALVNTCGQEFSNLIGKYIKANSIYTLISSNCLYDFTDCVILNCFGEKQLPSWLIEGTASYINYKKDNYNYRYGEYINFENLDFVFDENNYMNGYEFGYSLVNTIVQNYGEDKLFELLNSYGDIETVLGNDRTDLFDKWKIYIKDNMPENIYDYDDTNYIDMIDKSGSFSDEGGNVFNSYIKNENFEIYYNNSESNAKEHAEMTLEQLEAEYDNFINLFRVDKESMPIIKIYMYNKRTSYSKEMEALNLTTNMLSNGVTTCRNKFLFVYKEINDEWKVSCVHELNHIVCINAVKDMYIYRWLIEGLAMYYSQDIDTYGKAYYKNIVKAGIIDYRNLCYDNNLSYILGYSMVEYIISKYGEDSLIDLLYNNCSIENQFDLSTDEFLNDYMSFLKTKY